MVGEPHRMPDEVPDAVIAACRAALTDFQGPAGGAGGADMPRATLEKIARAELRKPLSRTP
jgi:crotonobetaine/carnitine-CoA ligase